MHQPPADNHPLIHRGAPLSCDPQIFDGGNLPGVSNQKCRIVILDQFAQCGWLFHSHISAPAP